MNNRSWLDDVEIKKANVIYHNAEAEFFERMHPEGSSVYEQVNVSRNITKIAQGSLTKNICVDVGCGTGFLTGFELPLYGRVVATDISKGMLRISKNRFGRVNLLHFVICDAEFLPLKSQTADLISVSSVLHHVPQPSRLIKEASRILKNNGYLFITREPNFKQFRRFFDFLDSHFIQGFSKIAKKLFSKQETHELRVFRGNSGPQVDVHYSKGFSITQLAEYLSSSNFEVVSAYSYHWIYPSPEVSWLSTLLARSNFIIEKLPLSCKFGRYITVIAKKRAQRNQQVEN